MVEFIVKAFIVMLLAQVNALLFLYLVRMGKSVKILKTPEERYEEITSAEQFRAMVRGDYKS